jgi:hypothetical protein
VQEHQERRKRWPWRSRQEHVAALAAVDVDLMRFGFLCGGSRRGNSGERKGNPNRVSRHLAECSAGAGFRKPSCPQLVTVRSLSIDEDRPPISPAGKLN